MYFLEILWSVDESLDFLMEIPYISPPLLYLSLHKLGKMLEFSQ